MQARDQDRLLDMLEAAKEARSLLEGQTRADLEEDRVLALALVRLLEIVGEAASQVSQDARREVPTVPWPDIVGMRNKLIHAYRDVDLDLVWDTVLQDLSPLIEDLQAALETPDEQS